MNKMAPIGQQLQVEQNLTAEDIVWLVAMAQAILRAFTWTEGQPIRVLAETLKISPTTFYTKLRLVVQAMMWVRRGKETFDGLVEQLQSRQKRVIELKQAYATAQAKVESLSQALTEAQVSLANLQAEAVRLKEQGAVNVERLIVVLKLSGHCTVRDIVEVLFYRLRDRMFSWLCPERHCPGRDQCRRCFGQVVGSGHPVGGHLY
jgi:hypothetical protein